MICLPPEQRLGLLDSNLSVMWSRDRRMSPILELEPVSLSSVWSEASHGPCHKYSSPILECWIKNKMSLDNLHRPSLCRKLDFNLDSPILAGSKAESMDIVSPSNTWTPSSDEDSRDSGLGTSPVVDTSLVTTTDQQAIQMTWSRRMAVKKRHASCSPLQLISEEKRRRTLLEPDSNEKEWKKTHKKLFHELEHSFVNIDLEEDSHAQIGDSSRAYLLPTVPGKHSDLKSITPETLLRVQAGEFSEHIERCHIIDCRYPYEFDGGHIKGASNLPTTDSMIQSLMTSAMAGDASKHVIVIFHCEFSSERAPSMCRFLRAQDRAANKESYPKLFYPELYILDGGYKAFFEYKPTECIPQSYRPMLDKNHKEDLRKFRVKSKSWHGDRKSSLTCRASLRF